MEIEKIENLDDNEVILDCNCVDDWIYQSIDNIFEGYSDYLKKSIKKDIMTSIKKELRLFLLKVENDLEEIEGEF